MTLSPHPNDDVRSSREAGNFPYGYPDTVCYIEVPADGGLKQVKGRAGIRDAISRAADGKSRIYAAWPGRYRTDLFFIDDLAALAEECGVSLAGRRR